MKRALLVVALAAGIGWACPAAAQQLIPADLADKAAYNNSTAAQIMAQALALLGGLGENGGRLSRATNREELLAAADQMVASARSARAEIRGLRAQAAALPSLGGPNAPGSLQISDMTVDNVEHLLGQVDGLLAHVEDMGAAIRAGDQARLDAALAALSGGVVVALDYQAETMRAGLRFTPVDGADHGISEATACYYQGAAAYYRGILKLATRTEAAAGVDAASQCMTTAGARAGAAFERAQAHPSRDAHTRAFMARLTPLTRARLDVVSDAPAILDRVRASLLDPAVGPDPDVRAAMVSIEDRLMAIQTQEDAIYSNQ